MHLGLYKAGDKHYKEVYGWQGSNPYGTEFDFVESFQNMIGCSPREAKTEARRQFMLVDLAKAVTLEDLKPLIERLIKEIER